MPATYIAGYDGSDAARAALGFTTRLASVTGATVVAANVYDPPSIVAGKGASYAPVAELDEDARHAAQAILSDLEVEKVVVSAPSPAAGLHHLTKHRHAA